MGREAYLNFGGGIGEDCVWRWKSVFLSMGESGEEARIGEEDRGDGTAGRWLHEPAKMGLGAKESILPVGVSLLVRRISIGSRTRLHVGRGEELYA